jgi:hypothetical protein
MRFEEYLSQVAKVINMHKTEAELTDAMAEGDGEKPGTVIRIFESVKEEIKHALASNKNLLGVFEENGEASLSPEEIKKREIQPHNLKRHMLAVRQNLRHHKKTSHDPDNILKKLPDPDIIIAKILEDITSALGVKDIGRAFGEDEQKAYAAEFGERKKKTDEAPKTTKELDIRKAPPGIEPGTPEFEKYLKEVMAKLRKEGTIR